MSFLPKTSRCGRFWYMEADWPVLYRRQEDRRKDRFCRNGRFLRPTQVSWRPALLTRVPYGLWYKEKSQNIYRNDKLYFPPTVHFLCFTDECCSSCHLQMTCQCCRRWRRTRGHRGYFRSAQECLTRSTVVPPAPTGSLNWPTLPSVSRALCWRMFHIKGLYKRSSVEMALFKLRKFNICIH